MRLGIVSDITNPRRQSVRVPADRFIKPPRFEDRERFQGPNKDMHRLNVALRQAFGENIVVEYGRDPSNGAYAYVAITLASSWDNELTMKAVEVVNAAL